MQNPLRRPEAERESVEDEEAEVARRGGGDDERKRQHREQRVARPAPIEICV
ncbi:MAG: hypothetical protein QGH74_05275 [Candidatus Brocadiia bacterium]|nr:hypothetical protein [Candidatus Brocadiia bacterium]